jgi:hypothetical protein
LPDDEGDALSGGLDSIDVIVAKVRIGPFKGVFCLREFAQGLVECFPPRIDAGGRCHDILSF